MLDFPSGPGLAVGQLYTSGWSSWMWDGAKWMASMPSGGVYLPMFAGSQFPLYGFLYNSTPGDPGYSTVWSGQGATRFRFKINPGDEFSAGSIDYRGLAASALSIVGAGTTSGNRAIYLYDNVAIAGSLQIGSTTVVADGLLVIGPVTSTGPNAQIRWEDRGNPASVWAWYASGGVTRLSNAGDRIWIDGSGNLSTQGYVTIGGNHLVFAGGAGGNTNGPIIYANTAVFAHRLGTGNANFQFQDYFGTTRFLITSDGFVGVNGAQSNYGESLAALRTPAVNATYWWETATASLQDARPATNGVGGVLIFEGNYTGGASTPLAGIGGRKALATDGDFTGNLALWARSGTINMFSSGGAIADGLMFRFSLTDLGVQTVYASLSPRRWRFAVNAGDEGSTGSIDYRGFDGAALSIVGAGTVSGTRAIKLWDNVYVPGNIEAVGSIATTGPNGCLGMLDRAGSSYTNWLWYAYGGTVRLYNGADRLTVNSAGIVTVSSDLYLLGANLWLAGGGAAGPRMSADQTNFSFQTGAGNGGFYWWNNPGAQLARLDNGGSLWVTGNLIVANYLQFLGQVVGSPGHIYANTVDMVFRLAGAGWYYWQSGDGTQRMRLQADGLYVTGALNVSGSLAMGGLLTAGAINSPNINATGAGAWLGFANRTSPGSGDWGWYSATSQAILYNGANRFWVDWDGTVYTSSNIILGTNYWLYGKDTAGTPQVIIGNINNTIYISDSSRQVHVRGSYTFLYGGVVVQGASIGFQGQTAGLGPNSGPLIYGDSNWIVVQPGAGNLGLMLYDRAGANRMQFLTNGSAWFTGRSTIGQIRLTTEPNGNAYGFGLYVDTVTFYMMVTNVNDAVGGFNGLRPFMIDLSTGKCVMQNGLQVNGAMSKYYGGIQIFQGGGGGSNLNIFDDGNSHLDSSTALHLNWNGTPVYAGGGFYANAGIMVYAGFTLQCPLTMNSSSYDRAMFIWNDNGSYLRIYNDSNGHIQCQGSGGLYFNWNSAAPVYSGGDFLANRYLTVNGGQTTQGFAYFNGGGRLYNGGSDPFQVFAPGSAHARLTYHVSGVRIWSCGVVAWGNWYLADESGQRVCYEIGTDGSHYIYGSLTIPNGTWIFGRDTAGTRQAVLALWSDNHVYLCETGRPLHLRGSTIYTEGRIIANTEIHTEGAGAGFYFMQRSDGNAFMWYASDNSARLWFNTIGDRLYFTINMDIYPAGGSSATCGNNAWWNVISNNFSNPSDPKLKQDIEPHPPALEAVRALMPVTYRWRRGRDTVRRHHGWLSTDVRAVLGDDFGGLIYNEPTNDHDGYDALAVNQLTAVLWRALQELADEVETLKAEVREAKRNGSLH